MKGHVFFEFTKKNPQTQYPEVKSSQPQLIFNWSWFNNNNKKLIPQRLLREATRVGLWKTRIKGVPIITTVRMIEVEIIHSAGETELTWLRICAEGRIVSAIVKIGGGREIGPSALELVSRGMWGVHGPGDRSGSRGGVACVKTCRGARPRMIHPKVWAILLVVVVHFGRSRWGTCVCFCYICVTIAWSNWWLLLLLRRGPWHVRTGPGSGCLLSPTSVPSITDPRIVLWPRWITGGVCSGRCISVPLKLGNRKRWFRWRILIGVAWCRP